MMLIVAIGIFFGAISLSNASRLVVDQIGTYRKIIESYRYNGASVESVTVDDIVNLIQLVEGNGVNSNPIFEKGSYEYDTLRMGVKQSFGDQEVVSWGVFQKIVDALYGDQISDDPYQPQEVHLSLTADPTSMKVMWVTMDTLQEAQVQYLPYSRLAANWNTASVRYATNQTYSVPQKWWPVFDGSIYEVDLTELAPEHKYVYRVGGYDTANATWRWSSEFTFSSAPAATNPDRKTIVATLADHGTFMLFGFMTVNKLAKVAKQMGVEMVFVAGDLSYAGIDADMPRANITSADEWMVGVGNHDMFYDAVAFSSRYKMPQSSALGSQGNMWYAYDYGNSHWISVSSEHPIGEGTEQQAFLVRALEAAVANRAAVPWIVLTIHKPIYCSADGSPHFADQLEALLIQYDVDITIVGHMHLYERIHPVLKGEVTVFPEKVDQGKSIVDLYRSTGKGPVHIVQGHAGAMQFERFQQPQPSWSAFRMANGFITPNISRVSVAAEYEYPGLDISKPENFKYTSTYGFGVITFANATHLHYTTVSDAIVKPGTAVPTDEFWIVKEGRL